jgi:NAD(P)-dependent dehydrogenase (short-subunit alcohol dehydrogenase family)
VKTWLITGCSSGIGRALAQAVIAGGDNVVVTSRKIDAVSDLAQATPSSALAASLDVTDPDQVDAAVAAAVERFGQVDVLVNNAGRGYRSAVEEATDDDITALFDANFLGGVRMIRAVLPDMRRRRSGAIVNVTSIAATVHPIASGFYGATKAAMEAVSGSLQKEVGPLGIDVMTVRLGAFRTGFGGAALSQAATEIADYAGTAGLRRKERDTYHGTEKGDPVKAAAAIIQAVGSPNPPSLLLLGNDALGSFDRVADAQRGEVDEWRTLSQSTDLDLG